VRYAPGGGAAFAAALEAALNDAADLDGLARQAGADPDLVRELAALLRGGEERESASDAGADSPAREVVVLWGERLTAGANGAAGARALTGIAPALAMSETDGAGLLEVPA